MSADLVPVPRKRTIAAVLLIAAACGVGAGALDRARGVPPSAAALFSEPPAPLQSPAPGHPAAAAPAPSTRVAAADISGANQ